MADPNEAFSQVLWFAAEAGYAQDVAPASGVCRAVWWDDRLWERLARLYLEEEEGETTRVVHPRCALESAVAAGEPAHGRVSWLLALEGAEVGLSLYIALEGRHEAAALTLLKAGANIYYGVGDEDEYEPPLNLACRHGLVAAALALLDRNAPAIYFFDHDIPLDHAIEGRHEELAVRLIEKGGYARDIEGFSGFSYLHHACQRGLSRVAEALLDCNVDVDAWYYEIKPNKHGTPLLQAIWNGHIDLAIMLLESGAAVDLADSFGDTPLHSACRSGSLRLAQKLVQLEEKRMEKSDIINARTKRGETPLMMALDVGHEDIALWLMDKGARGAKRADIDQWTALHYAAKEGLLKAVQQLLKGGANPSARTDEHRLPEELAKRGGHTAVAELLMKREKEHD